MAILADGQVAITQSDIFEVSGSDIFDTDKVSVSKVIFFNTSSITQIVFLFVKGRDGTARKVRRFKLQENESGEYLEPGETLLMEDGDKLQAITTTADVLDFTVVGQRI